MFGLTKEELGILKKLNTPKKIQDFLDTLKINFDYSRDTCMSPRVVLRKRKAHCIEGAMLAALALKMHGYRPLVVHLKATKKDYDHVMAVFNQYGRWGAINKSNHAVIRYREPIYRDIRELVMSIFHEYTDRKGRKNLRSFSVPVNLSRFDKKKWVIDEKDLWHIDSHLDKVKHFDILSRKQIANLRLADKIERKAGNITEWDRKGNRKI